MGTPQRSKIFFLRNLLINRSCQLRLLGYNVITIFVTGAFFMILNFNLHDGESIQNKFYWTLIVGFGVFLFLFFIGLWVSNKIVGPIYRMEKHMESLIQGGPIQELKFRAGDDFQGTAQIYNQLIKHIEQRGGLK